MSGLNVFVIRLVLAVFFAVILSRFFFPQGNIFYVIGLAIFLMGMAYVFEYWKYWRSRKR
ncbi:MAG: hypothetical protein RBR01_02065 [Desulfobacterales bacterium]|jgi:hypothetical protein|nr:hypothetical protein [Desulfobacterales bacterium]MDD3082291.1 hypothetical protein [Desulfobacterales bacterium]MDD3951410.1 hypothetical protein [Desulfobacterales bacterium]MDD4463927.1 hypothetical protein [Desulfobacterales bacterium]MDY0377198.1 hypothetical protein [Desulfobacterales bacterium]